MIRLFLCDGTLQLLGSIHATLLDWEERAGLFALFVFPIVSCDCLCFVTLPCGAVDRSVICDSCISWSYSFAVFKHNLWNLETKSSTRHSNICFPFDYYVLGLLIYSSIFILNVMTCFNFDRYLDLERIGQLSVSHCMVSANVREDNPRA